jgi:ADP-ribosyl-[dinitrogen reductase] hydrolase
VTDVVKRDRFRGALLGLAVGDAVGTTVEFRAPGTFEPVTDMVGGGPFGLPAGAWTDDTSMAMCLAESLVECGGFDPMDQLRRYVRWYREGHWSSTGSCFDIGNATRAALQRFERTGEPYPGDADPHAAGNGPLMKLAPVPMAFAADARAAIFFAGDSARTTHGAAEAIDACRYYAGLLVAALGGATVSELLHEGIYDPVAGLWVDTPLHPKVHAVAAGSFLTRAPPEIRGGGYVVHALEAALWALRSTRTFADGVLAAVNLGDDADTTAAIYGQLAGALYGAEAIPGRWRERLFRGTEIAAMADRLFELARTPDAIDAIAIEPVATDLNRIPTLGEIVAALRRGGPVVIEGPGPGWCVQAIADGERDMVRVEVLDPVHSGSGPSLPADQLEAMQRIGLRSEPGAWTTTFIDEGDRANLRQAAEVMLRVVREAWHVQPGGSLRVDDVPSPGADWEEITAFSATFDGYAHFGDRWGQRFNEVRARFEATGDLPDDVDDLRACLFLEFRRDRFTWGEDVTLSEHDGDGVRHVVANPDFENTFTNGYRRALVSRLRELLEARQRRTA